MGVVSIEEIWMAGHAHPLHHMLRYSDFGKYKYKRKYKYKWFTVGSVTNTYKYMLPK